MTHLACPDEAANPKNAAQLALFNRLAEHAPQSACEQRRRLGGHLSRPRLSPRPRAARHRALWRTARRGWRQPDGAGCRSLWPHRASALGGARRNRRLRRDADAQAPDADRDRMAGYADGFFRALSASDARDGPRRPYRRASPAAPGPRLHGPHHLRRDRCARTRLSGAAALSSFSASASRSTISRASPARSATRS